MNLRSEPGNHLRKAYSRQKEPKVQRARDKQSSRSSTFLMKEIHVDLTQLMRGKISCLGPDHKGLCP